MNKLLKKPHLIFLLSIPIILVIGILSGDAILDFNIHDTYYIISYWHLTELISIIFGIIAFGYWLMLKADRKLSKRLNLIHIILTVGGILIVWFLTTFYRNEVMEYEFNNNLTIAITSIVLLIIAVQLLFPINIIYGLTRKATRIDNE